MNEGGGKELVTDRNKREEQPTVKQSGSGANMKNRAPLGADGTGGGGYDAVNKRGLK